VAALLDLPDRNCLSAQASYERWNISRKTRRAKRNTTRVASDPRSRADSLAKTKRLPVNAGQTSEIVPQAWTTRMPKDDLVINDSEAALRPPDLDATAEVLEQKRAWTSFVLTALLVLACIYSLYVAKAFLLPVSFAVVFNLFLSPLVRAQDASHPGSARGGNCAAGGTVYHIVCHLRIIRIRERMGGAGSADSRQSL
jgi:hypothetical protein